MRRGSSKSPAQASRASSAVRRRSRRTRRLSQSTGSVSARPGRRRNETTVAAVPSPAAIAISSSRLRPGCRRGQRDALSPRAPARMPIRPSERAISGAWRSGLRTTIAISSGSLSASSRAILRPISSASPREPAASAAAATRQARSARSRARRGCARGGGARSRRSDRRRPLGHRRAELVAEDTEQLGPRGEGLAVLEGRGDDDLGRGGERADQLDLFAGQVVEAVEEDRTALPGVGRRAQGGRRGGGEVAVHGPARVAKPLVGGEEGDDLALELAGAGRISRGLRAWPHRARRPGGRRAAPRAPARKSPGGPERPSLRRLAVRARPRASQTR